MEPHVALALRLRELRKRRGLTQAQLAKALDVSVAAISSWESENNTLVPTDNRITALSTLYASSPGRGAGAPVLPLDDELTATERGLRDELVRELLELRTPSVDSSRIPLAGPGDAIGGGSWYFADARPVRVICGLLPEPVRAKMPYTTTAEPDYTSLYNLADLDALLELHGHLRATNPAIGDLQIRSGSDLTPDDLTCHLVVLGGVDLWSDTVLALVEELALPVRQVRRDDKAYFEVTGAQPEQHRAELVDTPSGKRRLRSDVAHFYRGPNPYNRRRTVTICNGLYARGTYGAVRALTDARFRDRNESHLAERFAGSEQISLLMRVTVPVAGKTLTPDWTLAETRLHEWP